MLGGRGVPELLLGTPKCWVLGLGFWVQCLLFMVRGLGFRAQGLGLRVDPGCLGFRVRVTGPVFFGLTGPDLLCKNV